MVKENNKKREEGFTLIEIIAVLVILGILAAVAIPRFTNLQQEARNSASQAAIAEAMARCSQEYAQQILVNNGDTSAINGTSINLGISQVWGDFDVTTGGVATGVNIHVVNVQGVATSNNNNDIWILP